MQRQTLPDLLAQRVTASHSAINKAAERTELQQQIDEFFARGGQVRIIPTGVGSSLDGILPVSDKPGSSMGVHRPNKGQAAKKDAPEKQRKDQTEGGKYICQQDAAAIVGVDPSYLGILIKKGIIKLTVQKTYMCAKYFLRSDVEALPPYVKQRAFGK